MVLSQPDLRKAVAEGRVRFDPPLEETQWGEASVDLRLGFRFTSLSKIPGMKISVAEGLDAVAKAGFWKTMDLAEFNELGKRNSCPVSPGEFILAFTRERVNSQGPDCAGGRKKHLRPRRAEYASDGTLDSARLEWSHRPRDHEQRSAHRGADTDDRQTVPAHVLPSIQRTAGGVSVRFPPDGSVPGSNSSAATRRGGRARIVGSMRGPLPSEILSERQGSRKFCRVAAFALERRRLYPRLASAGQ